MRGPAALAAAPRAEQLAHHALTRATVEELARNADLARVLLAALAPGRRQQVLADLGAAGSLRRRFVETLTRPTSPIARAYQH